jgi:hypothetical protein
MMKVYGGGCWCRRRRWWSFLPSCCRCWYPLLIVLYCICIICINHHFLWIQCVSFYEMMMLCSMIDIMVIKKTIEDIGEVHVINMRVTHHVRARERISNKEDFECGVCMAYSLVIIVQRCTTNNE